ncbi:MAG: hypothetical protein GY745_11720 [Actinomycetia bacterium]|nr:hypothetical protein [Actinomycetes bacterium]MCP4085708.1 hypothetical protein [Actinomycetes bacterium]
MARTNVAPRIDPPSGTSLHAFGFTLPASDGGRPSFVVSGAGDLHDQSELRPEAIVGGDSSWDESGVERASVVLDEIQARLAGLGVRWPD